MRQCSAGNGATTANLTDWCACDASGQVRKKLTNQIFALKVLDKSHMRKFGQVENTKQERRVLEIVNHPFIVKLHFAFQTHDKLCLVLDFVNGGELFSYIAKEKVR